MKILVAGGGPAGLSFAMLLKQRHAEHAITVLERDLPHETYGWGITLPRRMLARLEELDPAIANTLIESSVRWSEIQLFHRGRRVEIAGTPLLGIARTTLLQILQQRCDRLGVELRFGTAIDPAAVSEHDLLVAADGAGSMTRQSVERQLGTSRRTGKNRYTWLGTPQVFTGLTLGLAETPDGLFIAHAYPFSSQASTFIVECSDETWHAAGLDRKSGAETCCDLAAVFADCLRGAPLLFRRAVRWANFAHLQNEHWWHGRIVLLGDAAHAIHFSVGSGTMLAIDDAIALVDHLDGNGDVPAALDAFEHARKPVIDNFATLERTTVARLERMHDFVDLEPLELAYLLLSR